MAEPYDTDWSSVPDTDKNAVAIRLGKAPKGRDIVRIQNGRIRCATVSGYFVVADVLKPDTWRGKKTQAPSRVSLVRKKATDDLDAYYGK